MFLLELPIVRQHLHVDIVILSQTMLTMRLYLHGLASKSFRCFACRHDLQEPMQHVLLM